MFTARYGLDNCNNVICSAKWPVPENPFGTIWNPLANNSSCYLISSCFEHTSFLTLFLLSVTRELIMVLSDLYRLLPERIGSQVATVTCLIICSVA